MATVSGARDEEFADVPLTIKWSVFLAAASGIAYLCLLVVRPFLGIAAWATVLAITCYPLYQRLVRRIGRVTMSAFLTSAFMVTAVIVPLFLIGGAAVRQLLAIGESLRRALLDPSGVTRFITVTFAPFAHRVGLDVDAIARWAGDRVSQWAAGAGTYTVSAAAGIGGAIVSFALTAVATFLLLRHGETLVGVIPNLLPFERTRSQALLLRIRDVVHASMFGVVIIATIQGVLCGGMFWVLGVPAPALWGLVAVIASTVPLVGTAIVWAPGAVYLLATAGWIKGLVLAVWGAAVVSSVDNVLRPLLVAGRVRLSSLAMFVAMLGGLQAFGALGIILGPVLFATAAAILTLLRETPPSPSARRAISSTHVGRSGSLGRAASRERSNASIDS